MKDIFTLFVGRNFRCSQHLVKFVLYNTAPDTTDAARGQVYRAAVIYMDFLIVLQCRRLLLLFKDTCLIMKYNHILILRTEFLLKLRLYPIKRLHILKQQETGEPDQSTSVSKQNMRKLI